MESIYLRNRYDIGRCHWLCSCYPLIARKHFESLMMAFLDGQDIIQSFLWLVIEFLNASKSSGHSPNRDKNCQDVRWEHSL